MTLMNDMVRCLKALADENRLRLLMLLRERELCVFELMGILGLSQPLISSHLAVLREAGLATARREGKRMRYAVSTAARSGGKRGIVRLVADALAGDAVMTGDRERLRECADYQKTQGRCDSAAVARFRARGERS